MKELNKIETLVEPTPIQVLGKAYYYNYNIKPCKVSTHDMDKQEEVIKDGWSFTPIYIVGKPSYNDIVQHIIREYLTLDEEFDLINSYNKSVLTGLKDDKAIKKYQEYLQLLEDIKREVKQNINI